MNSEDLVNELRNTIDLIRRDGTTVLDERSIPVLEAAIKEVKEPCEDCIDREALMDIEYEDVIDVHGKQYVRLMEVADKTIKMPTVRPLSSTDDCEPCEDCISRQAAIGLFAQNADAVRPYSKTWGEVKALPSVTAQPKMGRWIDDCVCSNCRWAHEDVRGYPLITTFKFCPNCGAKMAEPQESEG